ncbi:MAG: hypothetical protein Q8L68_03405 [Methylococcales bacterium]|nr:hypothetical protein [Methylococcales bacterium]
MKFIYSIQQSYLESADKCNPFFNGIGRASQYMPGGGNSSEEGKAYGF